MRVNLDRILRAPWLALALLAACSSSQPSAVLQTYSENPPTVSDSPPAGNMPASLPQPIQEVAAAPPDGQQVTGGIFQGSGIIARNPRADNAPGTSDDGKDVTLNFVNTDIRDVAKAVLGDMLGLNYVVAPTVTGNITLKVNQPVPREALFATLDSAFRISGAALVSSGGMIKVVPVAEAPHQGSVLSFVNGRQTTPGFGLQIVPLRYISTEEIQKILSQVMPSGSVTPVESTHNILILAGTEEERANMLDVINSFDVDWLSGMSFGLFPLKEADAKVITHELWDVLGTPTGPLGKIVRLVPFDRLNAVLAVSSQPRYLKEIKNWIDRLDVNQAPSDRKIWVYRVQNGRAADLSGTLQKLIQEQGAKDTPGGKAGSTSSSALPFSFDTGSASTTPAGHVPAPPTPAGIEADIGDASTKGSPRIIADETTNSLIIWANKVEFTLIEDALRKLDIVPMQVRIEAVIAEVTLTDDLSYGVQYLFQKKNMGAILTNSATNTVSSALPGFSAFVTSSNINAILDLLQSVTTVHVISSPQIMVLNNQTATLQVGDQVPIATQSAVSVLTPGAPVVNSIQMVDTGVILKVTPRVNASGMVLMDIAQEVSDVTATTTSTIDSPTIEERKIASSIAVRGGETIALGGLIQDSVTDSKSGIPLLMDIPWAGNLFSTTTKNVTRTELLALITPHVVQNDNDIRSATADMREQMNAVVPLDAKLHQ